MPLRHSQADDFKRVRGIGPVMERRLHSAGIQTFVQLAALSPEKIAALLPGVSTRRIVQLNWIQQARKLIPKGTNRKTRIKKKAVSTIRQHYVNFTIEMLLDEKNEARRTRAVHIQSGDRNSWAGWEPQGLIDFLTQHTGVQPQASKIISQSEVKPKLEHATDIPTEAPKEAAAERGLGELEEALVPGVPALIPIETLPELLPPNSPLHSSTRTNPSPLVLGSGVLRPVSLEVLVNNMSGRKNIFPCGKPFTLQLELDLSDVQPTVSPHLEYLASIHARAIGGDSNEKIGEAYGKTAFADRITLNVEVFVLHPGLYRLEAAVNLLLTSGASSPAVKLTAWLSSSLIQIY